MDRNNSVVWDTTTAADVAVAERVAFLRRTYSLVAGAALTLVFLEYAFFATGLADRFMELLAGAGQFGWIGAMVVFWIASGIANRLAYSGASPAVQYLGLGIYILAETVILAPLLWIAGHFGGEDVIPGAALATVLVFTALSASVLMTRKDFSFLRGALTVASFVALGLILFGVVFGFSLGILFSFGMVLLLGGYTLYYTSQVLHHYPTGQHVAAALALFSCVATLFFYILHIVLSFSGDD